MDRKSKWVRRRIKCPEVGRDADLLVELLEENGAEVVNSISCDNPRLADLDNWDCEWSCWDKVAKKKRRSGPRK
jgi:hypothetical protein